MGVGHGVSNFCSRHCIFTKALMEQACVSAYVRMAEDCLASGDFSDGKLPEAGEIRVFCYSATTSSPVKPSLLVRSVLFCCLLRGAVWPTLTTPGSGWDRALDRRQMTDLKREPKDFLYPVTEAIDA